MRRMTLVCALAAAACSGDPVAPRASLSTDRALRYEAYSDQLRLLLVGSLELVVHGDSTVSGNWTIGWAPGVDSTTRVGPQVGSGALQGRVLPDTSVWLNLNPGFVDYNVLLSGAATVKGLSGRWGYSTIAGEQGHGRFTARYVF